MSLHLFVFSAIKGSLAFFTYYYYYYYYYFNLDFNSGAWNLKVGKRHQMKPTATPRLGAYIDVDALALFVEDKYYLLTLRTSNT